MAEHSRLKHDTRGVVELIKKPSELVSKGSERITRNQSMVATMVTWDIRDECFDIPQKHDL